MRYLLFAGGIFIFLACNNNAKKSDAVKADTVLPGSGAPQPVSTDTVFTGFGTEPFWSVYVIGNQKIIYHPMEGRDVEFPFVAATTPDANTMRYNSGAGGNSLELVIQKKECSDGMSEIAHPYSVDLLLNNAKYSGCGRMGK